MTDEVIMEAVKTGDLQQASLLFERYHKRIFNFLARMTMDRDAVEDLTQNVFLRIIKYRNSFKEGSKRFRIFKTPVRMNGRVQFSLRSIYFLYLAALFNNLQLHGAF